MIQEVFNRKEPSRSTKPDEVVALGAVVPASPTGEGSVPDPVGHRAILNTV